MSQRWKSEGEYVWVRVSFARADVFYNIPNCYAKVWVPRDSEFPPGDRYLCLEDVILPLSAEQPRRTTRPEGTNLVALRNMPRTFPGSDGRLFINQFQVASLMTLDAESELVRTLRRIARIRPLEDGEGDEGEPQPSSVVNLDARKDS